MSRNLEFTKVDGIDEGDAYVSRSDDGITTLSVTYGFETAQVELLPEDAQRLSDLLRTEPLLATVELIAALDTVLSLARSNTYHPPHADESIREVERARSKLREGLK